MKLKKQTGQFNTYSAEFTFGELLILRDALNATSGRGPEADEILTGMNWYLNQLPEPGEEASKGDGTSDSPNMGTSTAKDSLSPIELEPAPGQKESPESKEKPSRSTPDDGDQTLADKFKNVSGEKKTPSRVNRDMELPEPPKQ